MEVPVSHKVSKAPDEHIPEMDGATYPQHENPVEVQGRRLTAAQDAEAERRSKWEEVVAARLANPHAIVDYRRHRL